MNIVASPAVSSARALERIGSKQFALELFLSESEFKFPNGVYALGEFAHANHRYRSAGRFYWQAMRNRTHRWLAAERLSRLAFDAVSWQVRRARP